MPADATGSLEAGWCYLILSQFEEMQISNFASTYHISIIGYLGLADLEWEHNLGRGISPQLRTILKASWQWEVEENVLQYNNKNQNKIIQDILQRSSVILFIIIILFIHYSSEGQTQIDCASVFRFTRQCLQWLGPKPGGLNAPWLLAWMAGIHLFVP